MRLLKMDILLVMCLMTGSVLSHVENTRDILANNSLEFRTSPTDEITTLINTDQIVYHMEPDLHIAGNILFSDGYALGTTDGVTATTIAGSPSSYGNTVALGQLARFGHMRGFRQISSNHVIVVDSSHSCLRLVDRLTLETPWYAGYCTSGGSYSQGTTSARFNWPYGIFEDKKRSDMLLVTDGSNNAIRHVQVTVGSGLSSVTEFYKSSTLDAPNGLTQDSISGDLFITTARDKVFKLTYTTRSLLFLAGSSRGFLDGDFGSSRFYYPKGIILIDNGRKLILTDRSNHRLRLLDLITRQTLSLCTGESGHSDGDMSSCTLIHPMSLIVLNNTLYVGESQRIRKIQGKLATLCEEREYVISPETGLALVEVPGPGGTTRLSLPPGTYPISLDYSSVNCTVMYHVSDHREDACPNLNIQGTVTSDTGVAVVDVPLCGPRTGELSLPPGSYPLRITSDTFNCTVEYNVSDVSDTLNPCSDPVLLLTVSPDTGVALVDMTQLGYQGMMRLPPGNYSFDVMSDRHSCTVNISISAVSDTPSPCLHPVIRQTASPDTGVSLVDMTQLGSQGKLRLPPGNYSFDVRSNGESCTVNIIISDHRLRRRLVFQAQYDVQCETTTGNLAESPLTLILAQHAFDYQEICSTDCTRPTGVDIGISCNNHTLTVVWPSNLTYTGDVSQIPAELDQRLTSRIIDEGSALYLFLPEVNPPIVFPEQEENGGYMRAELYSYCVGEDVGYVKSTDSCEQQTEPDIPEM